MQIHQLQPKHANRGKRRVGRGGKKGTYSGKGLKGQKSRAGRKMEPFIRELVKRYPKLKGYRASHVPKHIQELNLSDLEKHVTEGQIITPKFLQEKGLVSNHSLVKVKILGGGKLTKKVMVENCMVSKSAKEAIEKAGGSVK